MTTCAAHWKSLKQLKAAQKKHDTNRTSHQSRTKEVMMMSGSPCDNNADRERTKMLNMMCCNVAWKKKSLLHARDTCRGAAGRMRSTWPDLHRPPAPAAHLHSTCHSLLCLPMQARMQTQNTQPPCIAGQSHCDTKACVLKVKTATSSASQGCFGYEKHIKTTASAGTCKAGASIPEAALTQVSACLPAWNLCRSLPVTASTVHTLVSAPTL